MSKVTLNQIEMIVAMFKTLNGKEQTEVLDILTDARMTPCERDGHNFKKVGNVVPLFFWFGKDTKCVCTICGKTLIT